MNRQNVLNIRSGYPALLGANKIAEGINFAVTVPEGLCSAVPQGRQVSLERDSFSGGIPDWKGLRADDFRA